MSNLSNLPDSKSDPVEQAHIYQQAVLAYEEAERQVVDFLAENGGTARQLSVTAYQKYRALAERRDETYDRMKTLERGLLGE